jgi:cbb3-type cytochrome oxidase cytochrome c subunit
VGPDLALAIPAHDDAWTRAHFRNPQGVVPGSVMPAMGLLESEVDSLTAYVDELRGGGPYSEQAPRLARRYCSECHRIAGRGGDKGPDLSAIGDARTRSFLHRYTEDPSGLLESSHMPALLAPEGPLTHAQIEDIARYLAAQRSTASRVKPSGDGS